MPFPFEVSFEEVQANLDIYVREVLASLTSEFMVLPRGKVFVEYAMFEQGYEALKKVTQSFSEMDAQVVTSLVFQVPITLIVLRCILGFTPPEWAYVAAQETGVEVP